MLYLKFTVLFGDGRLKQNQEWLQDLLLPPEPFIQLHADGLDIYLLVDGRLTKNHEYLQNCFDASDQKCVPSHWVTRRIVAGWFKTWPVVASHFPPSC